MPFFIAWALAIFQFIKTESVYFVFVVIWICFFASLIYPLCRSWLFQRHSSVSFYDTETKIGIEGGQKSNGGQTAFDSDGVDGGVSKMERELRTMINMAETGSDVASSEPALTSVLSKSNSPVQLVTHLVEDPQFYRLLLVTAIRCFSAESVLFCKHVQIFRELSSDLLMIKEQHTAARNIVSLYIHQGSRRQININSETRRTIETALLEGRIEKDMFDVAFIEIAFLIRHNIIPRIILNHRKWSSTNQGASSGTGGGSNHRDDNQ